MFYHAGTMGSGAIYREVTVKSALTRVQGMPFAWSLNPYYGCERACVYCYARDYHARRGLDTGAGFDREIDVKINFAELLSHELRRLRKRETYVRTVPAADLGTSPPHRPSIRPSSETCLPRASSSIASTARCCGDPSSSSVSPCHPRTGPSTSNLTSRNIRVSPV